MVRHLVTCYVRDLPSRERRWIVQQTKAAT
jgi:hypothetical protein